MGRDGNCLTKRKERKGEGHGSQNKETYVYYFPCEGGNHNDQRTDIEAKNNNKEIIR